MAAAKKQVVVFMTDKQPKKHSVRFEQGEDDKPGPVSNLYINNEGVAALGNPDGIKVTIEPA